MQSVNPSTFTTPSSIITASHPALATVCNTPISLDVSFSHLDLKPGGIIYLTNPSSLFPSINCMYAFSPQDPTISHFIPNNEQAIPQSPQATHQQYSFSMQYNYYLNRENSSEIPKCRRYRKNSVVLRCGKPMKNCNECLKKCRNYRRSNFRRRQMETKRVICSTCNKRPAMIEEAKQYRTCRECIERMISAYYNKRNRSMNAIKFYNLAVEHFETLPPELKDLFIE